MENRETSPNTKGGKILQAAGQITGWATAPFGAGVKSLRRRLVYFRVGLTVAFLTLGGTVYMLYTGTNQKATDLEVRYLVPLADLSTLKSLAYENHLQHLAILPTYEILEAELPAALRFRIAQMEKNVEINNRKMAALRATLNDSTLLSAAEKLKLQALEDAFKRYKEGSALYVDFLRRTYIPGEIKNNGTEKKTYSIEFSEVERKDPLKNILWPAFTEINTALGELLILKKDQGQTLLGLSYGQNYLYLFGALSLFSLLYLLYAISATHRRIINSLNAASWVVEGLANGDLSKKRLDVGEDEFGLLAEAVNRLNMNLLKIAGFAGQIGEGYYDHTYTPLSDDDQLGLALCNMRDKLEKVADEDGARNWAVAGMAQMGEILRFADDLPKLAERLISALSKYIGANQGALFVVVDSDPEDVKLTIAGSYAYDKRKAAERVFRLGEGFVGQCALEKEAIFISDVPSDYVMMTSGLGEATPRSLLIAPFVYNGVAYGVAEFAAFVNFRSHQIEFVKRLGESVGAALSSLKAKENTLRLLEEAQNLSQALQQKQDALLENARVLELNRNELILTQRELDGQLASLNNAAIVSETDLDGFITFVNDRFCSVSRYKREDLLGKNHRILKTEGYRDGFFAELWNTIGAGNVWRGEFKNRAANGNIYWVEAAITPVLDTEDRPIKFIGVQFDITNQKAQEEQIRTALDEAMAQEEELRQNAEEMEATQEEMRRTGLELTGQVNAMNNAAIVSEADLQGRIINVNDQFVKVSKHTREELLGQNHRILKSGHQSDDIFEALWANITIGEVWKGEIKNRAKDGSYYWVLATVTPVMDARNKPIKYVGVTFDITGQKLQEEQIRAALEISQAQEEELRQNSEELQSAQEEMRKTQVELRGQIGAVNNAGVVAEADLRGNITMVNEEFCRLSLYSREELLGQNHRILKSGAQHDEFYIEFWEQISHGKVWRGVFKNRAKDGSFYWAKTTVTPVLGFDGKPLKYIGVSFDITAQVLQEEKIQEALVLSQTQEEELRLNQRLMQETQLELRGQMTAIHHATIVSETDLHGVILSVNDEFIIVSKFSREEILHRRHSILKSGEHTDDFFAELWRTITLGRVWKGEIHNKTKDGHGFWVATTITPVLDADGKPLKFIGIQFDISTIKIQETKLREALDAAHRHEEDLQQKQEQLDGVFANVPGVIYRRWADENWTLFLISEHARDLTGYPPSDFLKNKKVSFKSLVHPDDLSAVVAEIEAAVNRQEPYRLTYRIIDRNKKTRWVREEGRGVYRDGELSFLDGAIFDITLQKQLEDNLKETLVQSQSQEERLREAAEIMQIQQIELEGRIGALNNAGIVSEADLEGVIIFVNDEAVRTWGYSRGALIGKKHNILKSAEHKPEHYEKMWANITAGKVWRGEVRNRAADETEFWVFLTITPVFDQDKKPFKYIGVAYDITRQKRQASRIKILFEESKRQEEEVRNYSRTLETVQNEILTTQLELAGQLRALNNAAIVSESDLSGNIIFVNDEAPAVWGYTKEELIGQNHRILKSEAHDEAFFKAMWETLTQGEVWRGQVENLNKAGNRFWVELTITPVLDEAQKPIKYVGVSFNITAQKNQARRIHQALSKAEEDEARFNETIRALQEEIGVLQAAGGTKTEILQVEVARLDIEALPLPAAWLDAEGRLLEINKPYARALGEKIGASFKDCFYLQTAGDFPDALPLGETELRFNRPNGEEASAQSYLTEYLGAEGATYLHLLSVESARPSLPVKQTPPPSTHLAAHMRVFSLVSLLFEIDLKGNICEINDLTLKRLGYKRADVLGKPFPMLAEPDTPRSLYQELVETLNADKIWNGTLRFRTTDGASLRVTLGVAPIKDENGAVVKFICLAVERSAASRTALLQASLDEERRRQTLDRYALIYETDAQGLIVYINDAFVQLADFAVRDLIGKDHSILASGAVSPKTKENGKVEGGDLYQALAEGKLWSGEIVGMDGGGNRYRLSVHIAPHNVSNGMPSGFLGVGFPIAEAEDGPRPIFDFSENPEALRQKIADLEAALSGIKTNGKIENGHERLNGGVRAGAFDDFEI